MRADEMRDLGLPTYRANINRHSTRQLIRPAELRNSMFFLRSYSDIRRM